MFVQNMLATYLDQLQSMCGAGQSASLGNNLKKLLCGTRTPFLGYGDMEDFTPSRIYDNANYIGYTVTAITAGTLVMADEVGGVLQLTPGTNENEGIQMQTDGEIVLLAAGKDFYFEAKIRCADVDQTDIFVGMGTTDTSFVAGPPNDLIGFWTHDADSNLDFQVAKDGTGSATDTTVDMVDATWINVGFHVSGITSVTPYINGVAQTPVTANICDDEEMAITFGVDTGEAVANTLDLDWYWWMQLRDTAAA